MGEHNSLSGRSEPWPLVDKPDEDPLMSVRNLLIMCGLMIGSFCSGLMLAFVSFGMFGWWCWW